MDGDFSILADNGYGITPWLVNMFQAPSNVEKDNFNKVPVQVARNE